MSRAGVYVALIHLTVVERGGNTCWRRCLRPTAPLEGQLRARNVISANGHKNGPGFCKCASTHHRTRFTEAAVR